MDILYREYTFINEANFYLYLYLHNSLRCACTSTPTLELPEPTVEIVSPPTLTPSPVVTPSIIPVTEEATSTPIRPKHFT